MRQVMANLEGILRQCRELCTLVQVRVWLVGLGADGASTAAAWRRPCVPAQPTAPGCPPVQPCCCHPSCLAQRLADGGLGVEAVGEALRGISREFHLKLRVLYPIMQSSKLGSRAPALRQLVSRLNFNGWADRQARPNLGGGGHMPPISPMKAGGGGAAAAMPPISPI